MQFEERCKNVKAIKSCVQVRFCALQNKYLQF